MGKYILSLPSQRDILPQIFLGSRCMHRDRFDCGVRKHAQVRYAGRARNTGCKAYELSRAPRYLLELIRAELVGEAKTPETKLTDC